MWPFKKHQADEYFRHKMKNERPETAEGWDILLSAKHIRHRHPDLTGPELIRLVYWGVRPTHK